MKGFEELSEQQIERIQQSRRRVIESIGKNMDLYGVTLSIGHLYGNMYFSTRPVTLDEMSETMGMSKTSMSTGMRTLMDLKMIKRVWEKGARKDLYEPVSDWHQNFIDYFSVKWRKAIEVNVQALKESLAELKQLKEENPEQTTLHTVLDQDVGKIIEALNYYQWLNRVIDLFESEEIFNVIPKENLYTED